MPGVVHVRPVKSMARIPPANSIAEGARKKKVDLPIKHFEQRRHFLVIGSPGHEY